MEREKLPVLEIACRGMAPRPARACVPRPAMACLLNGAGWPLPLAWCLVWRSNGAADHRAQSDGWRVLCRLAFFLEHLLGPCGAPSGKYLQMCTSNLAVYMAFLFVRGLIGLLPLILPAILLEA